MLDLETNYIVSGLERSGTSMMMQILQAGGVSVAFDDSRLPDESNPKGYFELEGGKIINKLKEGLFPFDKYKGQFVKITAYGMMFLPRGQYKILYMERNLEEVLDSMEKMAKIKDTERDMTRETFRKLNEKVRLEMSQRDDIEVLVVNYNQVLQEPSVALEDIYRFLDVPSVDLKSMVVAVDERLYRQRRKKE